MLKQLYIFYTQKRETMDLLQNIKILPRIEKLKVMEFLWEELSANENEFKSPEWHKKTLKETELRAEAGEEELIDWRVAKQKLRNEFI